MAEPKLKDIEGGVITRVERTDHWGVRFIVATDHGTYSVTADRCSCDKPCEQVEVTIRKY